MKMYSIFGTINSSRPRSNKLTDLSTHEIFTTKHKINVLKMKTKMYKSQLNAILAVGKELYSSLYSLLLVYGFKILQSLVLKRSTTIRL